MMTPFPPTMQMMRAPENSLARVRVGLLRLERFTLDSRAR